MIAIQARGANQGTKHRGRQCTAPWPSSHYEKEWNTDVGHSWTRPVSFEFILEIHVLPSGYIYILTYVHLFHTLPSESFPSTFWKQHKLAATKKNLQGMRWDQLMVRWCLYLRHLSSGAYELLRSSGVLSLPSQRMLRDYTYYTTANPGFPCKFWMHNIMLFIIISPSNYNS